MFRPSDLIIDAFIRHLDDVYADTFGGREPECRQTIRDVARMALSHHARSNAPYHDMDHTIHVTIVGQDILRGKIIRDGNVSPRDWTAFVSALLCFALGFVRGICPGDTDDAFETGEEGAVVAMPRGATDGYLWPYFTSRSKLFVRNYFAVHPVLDGKRLADIIEYSRFPPPEGRNLETATYPGLLRAAHIIGAVSDPNFMLKMRRLFIEFIESGIGEDLGYPDHVALKNGYPDLFWDVLHPRIREGIRLLTYTGEGRVWLANMHRHVMREEHRGDIA